MARYSNQPGDAGKRKEITHDFIPGVLDFDMQIYGLKNSITPIGSANDHFAVAGLPN